MSGTSTVIPCLRYRDAAAAIVFLREAFGFVERAAYPGEGGRIEHAEMMHGTGMVMLGSSREDGQGWLTVEAAGGFTQTNYVIVEDVDAHCARARLCGARSGGKSPGISALTGRWGDGAGRGPTPSVHRAGQGPPAPAQAGLCATSAL